MITFEHVKVVYDDFVALPDFDLHINEGEFFTFLGPSGCGKSTALRALSGFVAPSQGKIIVGGRDVTFAHSSKRGIGMVFQNYALFPSMNVKDNIKFGLETAKVPKAEIETRVAEAASQVDLLEDQLGKEISELSGGQQQRVAIARALVMKPTILLLDEPLSNLDARLRRQLRGQLKQLQEEVGITTVYVTHDQEEALSLSDRIAVLNQGQIEQVGSPQELYDESETEFVCTFLGETNRISDAQVHELNQQGAGFNPEHNHYVRLERLRFSNDSAAPDGAPVLPATVTARHYFGDHSVYDLDCLGSPLKITAADVPHAPTKGEQIFLSADPKWIRSYDKSGRRVASNARTNHE
ncbi:ABC transporter ATP-binding protein [Corynebacterium sanguinis]|uniref:Trehalose import ATP-binding protein SugC n=1 Tax=Corynebacterium sanguinis TaxID=2594913 RepID=A0A6C1TV66_9CORY|nr:ABC transporter ATP-binding protein [Corynebacterium sanguinis]TVS26419.1 ABC transporter ATP-binding protein [Corynebacterium sanguinis]